MVVMYFRHPPIKMDAQRRPAVPYEVEPRLLEAASKLGQIADFLVISANGPHVFREALEQASGLKILSMIDLAIAEAQRRGWQRIGAVGLGKPTVYLEPLAELGINTVVVEETLDQQLSQAILAVMEGRNGPVESAAARAAMANLRAQEADGIILGCTELPILLADDLPAEDMINTVELMAEAAVDYALAD